MNDKKTYVMYKGWSPMIKNLPPEKAGELMIAVCAYQDGEEYTFSDPILASIFEMMKSKFNEDAAAYEETCRKNSENGKKGGRPPKAEETQEKRSVSAKSEGFSEKAKKAEYEYEYDNDNDSLKEKPPKGGKEKSDPVANSALSDPLKEKLRDWLRYKLERREPYKPMGLKSLITLTEKHEQQYGTAAVIDVINSSMGAGYKGIVWDGLKNPRGSPNRQQGDKLSQKFEEMKKW